MSHFAEPHLPPRSGLLRLLADDWTPLFLLLLVWALLLVWHQNLLPMQAWDESRIANNALEMARGGHWFTPTYDGAPDHWNTKPPLLIWLVAALFPLGGPPLLALPLPSLLAWGAT